MEKHFGIDLDAARAFLAAKDESRDRELDSLFEKAWSDFEAIAAHIMTRFQPRRIYQWGSLLDRRKFTEISDIDIAIEGLQDTETYFALLGEIMAMTSFPLDIVEMEKVGQENARYIRESGRLVHERP